MGAVHDPFEFCPLSPFRRTVTRDDLQPWSPQLLPEPFMAPAQEQGHLMDQVALPVGFDPAHAEAEALYIAGQVPRLDPDHGWSQPRHGPYELRGAWATLPHAEDGLGEFGWVGGGRPDRRQVARGQRYRTAEQAGRQVLVHPGGFCWRQGIATRCALGGIQLQGTAYWRITGSGHDLSLVPPHLPASSPGLGRLACSATDVTLRHGVRSGRPRLVTHLTSAR